MAEVTKTQQKPVQQPPAKPAAGPEMSDVFDAKGVAVLKAGAIAGLIAGIVMVIISNILSLTNPFAIYWMFGPILTAVILGAFMALFVVKLWHVVPANISKTLLGLPLISTMATDTAKKLAAAAAVVYVILPLIIGILLLQILWGTIGLVLELVGGIAYVFIYPTMFQKFNK